MISVNNANKSKLHARRKLEEIYLEESSYRSAQNRLFSLLLSTNTESTTCGIKMLYLVSCGCETRSLTVKVAHSPRVFEKGGALLNILA
jgi:hypothetical protein